MYTDNFKQIVIWGHKLYTHTHSYIHYGFHRAFNHMGYKCLWLDNKSNIYNIDFSNTLFITEGQVDEKIPLRHDCFYVLHNCNGERYKTISNKINLQTFTKTAIDQYKPIKLKDEFGYYLNDGIYLCWATDLLPLEIDNEIKNLNNISPKNEINFIGMPVYPWDIVKQICIEKKMVYRNYGGFNKNTAVSCSKNKTLIQESIIAPSVQSDWQVEHGYIPCRIFKNISYGKMGLTNNPVVYELFDKKILYDSDVRLLLDKGFNFYNIENMNDIIIDLMKQVRDKHTYINRIKALFWFINYFKT